MLAQTLYLNSEILLELDSYSFSSLSSTSQILNQICYNNDTWNRFIHRDFGNEGIKYIKDKSKCQLYWSMHQHVPLNKSEAFSLLKKRSNCLPILKYAYKHHNVLPPATYSINNHAKHGRSQYRSSAWYPTHRNDVLTVKWFHDVGISPDDSCLNEACDNGNLDMIKFFVEIGMEITFVQFRIVAKRGTSSHIAVMTYLLTLPIPDSTQWVNSACGGSLTMVQFLWDRGFKPDRHGTNFALQHKHPDIWRFLITEGIYPTSGVHVDNCFGHDNVSPVTYMLVNKGFAISNSDMHLACMCGMTRLVRFLLRHGIIPTQRDVNRSCSEGWVDTVRVLLRSGYYPDSDSLVSGLGFRQDYNKRYYLSSYSFAIPLLHLCLSYGIELPERIIEIVMKSNKTELIDAIRQHSSNKSAQE